MTARAIPLVALDRSRACRCWCHRELLTVAEAAEYLRIGRNKAYELARQFRASGAVGLPVVVLSTHALRVPAARLREWCGIDGPGRCHRCGHAADEGRPA